MPHRAVTHQPIHIAKQRAGRRPRPELCILAMLILFSVLQIKGRDVVAPVAGGSAELRLGVTIGGAAVDPARLDAFAERVGDMPSIVMVYQLWTEPLFDGPTVDAIAGRGATPMITWEPWKDADDAAHPTYTLPSIVAGDHDAYIAESARLAADWGGELLVRFAHEMNSDWVPWGQGVNGNTPADFVAAWRHVVGIFKAEGADNVRWVWSPNVDEGGRYPFAELYPGDDWVDWVGLDGYNWGTELDTEWRSVADIFGESYDTLTAMTDKPVMIAEFASAEAGGDKAAWIRDGLLVDVPQRLPEVTADIWFDFDTETNWRIDSSQASLTAYREVVDALRSGQRR